MEPKEGLSRRIFIKSAAAAGITLVGLTGCGSQDDVVFTGSGGPNGQPAAGVPQVNVPTLTFTSRVEPAAVPGVDAGTRYSVRVVASQGGKFTLPDGTIIFIPPGAFPADTDASVVIPTNRTSSEKLLGYLFEPSGLVLNSPIFITLPISLVGAGDIAMSFTSSTSNPIVDVGSERTNWTLSVPADPPAGAGLTLSLSHFTFLFGAVGTDLGMYLVTAIPPENLEVGDFVFFLTGPAETGIRWAPGHVAALIKEGADNNPLASSPGRCVEMGGLGAGDLQPVELEHAQFTYDHVYLGPRRHPQGLTASEKIVVRDYWLSKRGTPYALMGDQGDNVLEYEEGFSCVGMCEVGLRKVNKGLISWLSRQFASTPLEFYIETRPVTDITVVAGKKFEMPVYGVVADSSENTAPFLKEFWQGFYSRTARYDIAPLTSPPNSTFVPTDLPTSSYPGPPTFGPPAPGYLFSWTPTQAQIGETFELQLLMVADRRTWQSEDATLRDESRRTLRFTVVSNKYKVVYENISPADQNKVFADVVVNSKGSFAFATTEFQPDQPGASKEIYAKIGTGELTLIESVAGEVVTSVLGGDILHGIVMNEDDEIAYNAESDNNTGDTFFGFKRPGRPLVKLGPLVAGLVKLLPVDGDDKALLFLRVATGRTRSSADMVSLDLHDPNPNPAPLEIQQLSGQIYEAVDSFDINSSGLAYGSGITFNQPPAPFATINSFRYQYPTTTTPESAEALTPVHRRYVLNEQGDLAYTNEDATAIIIERKNRPQIVIPAVGNQVFPKIKLNDNGDLFVYDLSTNNLLLFSRDNSTTPENVTESLGLDPIHAMVDFDVAGPYLGVVTGNSVRIYEERIVV